MEEQKKLSPETAQKIVIVAVIEMVVETAIVLLLLFVLQWEFEFAAMALIVAPTIPCGAYIIWLIMQDDKKQVETK